MQMSKIQLKIKELWCRLWAWVFGYEWSYPFCNRLTCPLNNPAEHKCKIELKQPYWKIQGLNERICSVDMLVNRKVVEA